MEWSCSNHFWPYFGELQRCVTASRRVIHKLADYLEGQRPRDKRAMVNRARGASSITTSAAAENQR